MGTAAAETPSVTNNARPTGDPTIRWRGGAAGHYRCARRVILRGLARTWTLRMRLFVSEVLLAAALAAPQGHAGEMAAPRDPAQWQAMARADLDAAHAIIVASHPGVIDAANPGFNRWVEQGYREAQAFLPYVVSYDTALSAVRYYTSGFQDSHLAYSDDIRKTGYPILVDGWMIGGQDGRYRVASTVEDWPVRLPPVGADVIECDGRAPEAILREEVAPFVDRRDVPEARALWRDAFWARRPTASGLRQCRFRTADGATLELEVAYAPISMEQLFAAISEGHDGSRRSPNRFDLRDGTLWVQAGNFNLRAGSRDAAELEAMLEGLSAVHGAKRIVFDVRGNSGGDSTIGSRIFDAATGGLDYDASGWDRLPRLYAQWRVSDLLVATVTNQIERLAQLYGAASKRVADEKAFLAKIQAARAAGRPWVEQDAGRRIARADITARHGRLRRFDGPVVLLTEEGCVSACLDFADQVLLVPGSLHVGRTTNADSVYIDAGRPRLPSGNGLLVPLKVWRNRVRGNNQPLVPDVRLEVDMSDDEAVRGAVLAVLARR
jgi:hypothetical protein